MNAMPAPAAPSAPAPVNLYTEPAFLDVIAEVYHAGRRCRVRDFEIGGDLYRLLEVEGLGPLRRQVFIDVHEPLGRAPQDRRGLRALPRLEGVAGAPVRLADFSRQEGWEARAGAPVVLWDGFTTWADYLALLQSRRLVSEDLRRGRRLREHFRDLAFGVDDDAPDVLPTCFEWKSGRDRSLGRPDLFADERNKRFFAALRERGLLRASTLRGKGRLLAIWLGAVHRGRWSGWVFSFNPDPALARYSLGQQLVYRMLEHGHGEGHAEFDFSIGMEPYKLKLATHVRPIGLAGTPAPARRAADAVMHWLVRHPRLHDTARTLRRRLAPAASAGAAARPS